MDGFRKLRQNTQERAMSTDINRMQSFIHQDQAEIFRGMLDAYITSDDDDFTPIEPSAVETPIRAEIINGLLVRPQSGVLSLLVDAGAVFFMNPDAAPDESNYKFVRDLGLSVLGSLVMTANASGSTRIDVIECQINSVEATVTDSRDIFNPATGLFTPAVVTKEIKSTLTYRVRTGTPGAGFPASQSGWLPLVVASVPNGTTSNDTITFWDVRPLISDRKNGSFYVPSSMNEAPRVIGLVDQVTNLTDARFSGIIQGGSIKGRRVGGRIRRGTPGTDTLGYLQLGDAASQEGGGVVWGTGAQTLWYLYLLTPFGLPRWARYTGGPAGRVPRAPKGIPVVSMTGPQHITGAPSAAITLPNATGLVGSTTDGICVFASSCNSGTGPFEATANGYYQTAGANLGPTIISPSVVYDNTTGYIDFQVQENLHYPAHARAILVSLTSNITIAANTAQYVGTTIQQHKAAAAGANYTVNGRASYLTNGSSAGTLNFETERFWIPIMPNFPNPTGFAAAGVLYRWNFGAGAGVSNVTVSRLRIHAWDVGP
jgi:hypothetical protein